MDKVWSSKEFWSKYWDKEKRTVSEFTFSKLMEKYINFKAIDSYMEIGGAPGVILTYMNQKYGLTGSVIDYVDKKYTENVLEENGIKNYSVYEEDFTAFNPMKHSKRYDLVASWGFVEHFDKTEEVGSG